MENIKKNFWLIIFTLLVLFFSFWYVSYVTSSGGLNYVRSRTPLERFGRGLGVLGFFSMGLVYGRSILKIIVRENSFWEKLAPLGLDEFLDVKSLATKFLVLLNKTHAYLGVLSVALIFLHCYLTGSYLDNFLLQVVLVLMAIEAISGFVLKLKYSSTELKQKSYLIHRQFMLGVVIIVFTLFGHLILKR